MLGHNNGPPMGDIADTPDVGRRYYWKVARKAARRTPPVEIIKLRDRAAARVGLSYDDYTSILLDRGRRPSAVIFTLRSLVRARRDDILFDAGGSPLLMPGVEDKLRKLTDCSVFVVTNVGLRRPSQLASALQSLQQRTGGRLAKSSTSLQQGTQQNARNIREMLSTLGLPAGQAILVGDTVEDEACAAAAGVARFFWAWHYFGEPAHLA